MVKAMNARIEIIAPGREKLTLTMPQSVRVEKSWRQLTDSASITLPRKWLFEHADNVRQVFPTGAAIAISLGFNNRFTTEFNGYITGVSDELPLTLTCEDEMWKLKSEAVHIATQTKTFLPDFIAEITDATIKSVASYELGAMRFAHTTTAKVLEYLQEKLKLYSYFEDGALIVGEIYAAHSENPPTVIYVDHALNSSLKYEDRKAVPVKVTAVSTLSNGEKIEVTVGDENGTEQRTSHYNITDKATLEKLANQDLRKYNRSRYTGSVEVYQDIVVNHGDKVELVSDLYPERNGVYYVDKVVLTFDASPMNRREIGIDELVVL